MSMLVDASLTPGVTGAGSSPLPPDPNNLGPSSSAALVAVLLVPASTLPPWTSPVAVSVLAATSSSAFSTAPNSDSSAVLLGEDAESEDDDDETVVLCVICQDPLVHDNAEVEVLPCGHVFHAACVRHWWEAYPYHARCCAIYKQPATFENTYYR
jgi:hypothetical protein